MNNKGFGDLFGVTDYLGKLKMKLRCVGISIARCIKPLDDTALVDMHSQKAVAARKALVYTLMSFLLSFSKIHMGIYPFGIPVLVSYSGSTSLFGFFGYSLACLARGYKGLVAFVSGFLIYLVRKSVSGDRFCESVSIRLATSLASSLIVGACTLFEDGFAADALLSFFVFVCMCVICTFLFCIAFDSCREKIPEGTYTLSVYALCACLVTSFSPFSVLGIDVSAVAASVFTLWISKSKGPVYGCVSGFITGFSCTNPLLSAPLGISGLVSGYLFAKSGKTAVLSYVLCCCFTGIYLFGLESWKSCLVSALVAGVVFVAAGKYLPDVFSARERKRQRSNNEKSTKSEFDKVSESLSGISSVIYKFAEHLKAPSNTETAEVFDASFSEVCASCSMSSMCYAKKECNFASVKSKTVSLLKDGLLKEEQLSDMLLGKCIKVKQLCERLNSGYSELNFIAMKANRTQTVAGLYNSMSHLIKSTSKTENENKARDVRLENKISEVLRRIGVEFTHVTVNGTRFKEICVHGVRADKIPCSSADLAQYLSEECRVRFSEPEFDISDSASLVMKFTRGEIISLEYAQCCEAKKPNEVNGDTVSLFDSDRGYFYCIISDGMGNGKAAAASSRLSCVLLEKLLMAGTAKNVCLELLNNLLLSKNDETFSTVDMLEIDKLSGSAYFIKAGAAPSFVLRNNHLYKINSETPPVGIIPAFSAESTRFSLESGDIIFMVSDGIIQSDADAVWLSELIKLDSRNEPALLASQLVERARTINDRRDDASACVIKVCEL